MTQAVDNESTKQAASNILEGANKLERYAKMLEAIKAMNEGDEVKAIRAMAAVSKGMRK